MLSPRLAGRLPPAVERRTSNPMRGRHPLGSFTPGAAVAIAAAALAACSPIRDNNGNLLRADLLQTIEPGKHSREQVRQVLGSPSARTTFGDNKAWYYIGKRTETTAFLEPEVLEHQVIEIRFGDDDRVSGIRKLDASKAGKPVPVARVTPARGNEFTILEHIIGNIGRFTPVGGE